MKKILLIGIALFVSACSAPPNPVETKTTPRAVKTSVTSPLSISTLKAISNQFSSYGWTVKSRSQVPAAQLHAGAFIKGYQSPSGSQVFMTKYQASDSHKSSAQFLNSSMNLSAYSKVFKIFGRPKTSIKSLPNGLIVYQIDMTGNGDGVTLRNKSGIKTRYVATYVPVRLADGRYSALTVSYRGKEGSQSDFSKYINYLNSIKLPSQVSPLI